jgi:hypothetical protein
MTALYMPGSDLEIPGLEAILEYGDAAKYSHGSIPGAMLINDHSKLDRVRITQLDGLHDDPEASESRQANADHHGETTGRMLYRGRTLGITGRVEAGNLGAMRDTWRQLRRQFGVYERDLLVHHPFEVRSLTNEVLNPNLSVDDYGWEAAAAVGGGTSTLNGGVTSGILKVGEMTVAGATSAGYVRTFGHTPSEWRGEDVWISIRVKVQSASGGTVTSLGFGLAQWSGPTRNDLIPLASALSPSTNVWYTLAVRVSAARINPTATQVAPLLRVNFSGAGSYTARFFNCACILLRPDEPSPSAYFSGDTSGFEWSGTPEMSRSYGPAYAQNKIIDPRFEDFDVGTKVLKWWFPTGQIGGTPPTPNTLPSRSNTWSGEHVQGSLYYKATKNETNSQGWGIYAQSSDDLSIRSAHSAHEFRRYRFSARIKALQIPPTGTFDIRIFWLDAEAGGIFTNTSDPIVVGEDSYSVTATAPSGTAAARLVAYVTGPTSIGDVLEFFMSDVCFIDVTDWDPGNFYGVGDSAQEVDVYRRIPRPFLLKKVRKTSDMKAPEQQSRSRAWRDFTMSLRAGDPRIYCLDERRQSLKLPTVASMAFVTATGTSFTTGVTPPPVPTGFTYLDNSGTTSVEWTRFAMWPTNVR